MQENDNFFSYTIDYINYKLFLCYKLFFNAYYIRHSLAFFIILIIFVIVCIFDFIYLNHTLEKLKLSLIKQLPPCKILYKDLFPNSQKRDNIKINDGIITNPLKKDLEKGKNQRAFKRRSSKRNKSERISLINTYKGIFKDGEKKTEGPIKEILIEKKDKRLENRRKSKKYSIIKTATPFSNSKEIKKNEEDKKEENLNELPYSKAIELDKRNIFHIFYLFLIEKLEFINIFCTSNRIKIILFVEYILSLLINFFFNALLYSDEVVSHKYHNNGELDFFVSLALSILSNIISSIICSSLRYSTGIDEKIDLILEIKYDKQYFINIKKFYLYLKIKFIFFFIAQLIIFATCIYYIEIFCVKYYCSQISLITNYSYSFIESIIASFSFALIIAFTRKIGLCCANKYLYNTSKYINSKT